MSERKLGDLVKIKTGKLDANASNPNGIYPFFTCAEKPLKIDSFSYDCECVLVAGNGDLNVKYYSGKFDAYQRTYIIQSLDTDILDNRYLYLFLDSYLEQLRHQAIGGVIKYIKLNYLQDAKISLRTRREQEKIIQTLGQVKILIEKRRQSLAKLDQLAQSIFLDMFGDPVTNPKSWKEILITNVATEAKHAIGIGPFGSDLLASDYRDSGVPLVFVKNIRENSFSGALTKYVTTEKAKVLKAHTVSPRDVLMTKMGDPPGDPAVYPDGLESAVITADCIKITVNEEIIDPYFLCAQFDTSTFREVVAGMARGVAQKKINLELYKSLKIILPPKKEQTAFVKSLARLGLLKKGLIQSENHLVFLQQSLSQKFFGE